MLFYLGMRKVFVRRGHGVVSKDSVNLSAISEGRKQS